MVYYYLFGAFYLCKVLFFHFKSNFARGQNKLNIATERKNTLIQQKHTNNAERIDPTSEITLNQKDRRMKTDQNTTSYNNNKEMKQVFSILAKLQSYHTWGV